jgi:hypothetical protein
MGIFRTKVTENKLKFHAEYAPSVGLVFGAINRHVRGSNRPLSFDMTRTAQKTMRPTTIQLMYLMSEPFSSTDRGLNIEIDSMVTP